MRGMIQEYGKTLVYVITGILCIGLIWLFLWGGDGMAETVTGVMSDEINESDAVKADDNETYLTKSRPTLEMNQNVRIDEGQMFNVLSTPGVKAIDGTTNADILNKVQVFGTFCGTKLEGNASSMASIKCTTPGLYRLRYSLRDSSGFYVTEEVQIIVDPIL